MGYFQPESCGSRKMGETKYHFLWNDKLAAKMQQANFNTKVPFIFETVLSQGRLLSFKSTIYKTPSLSVEL